MHPSFDLPVLEFPFKLGVLFLFISALFYFFPPKKINSFYGYRTNNSMENQEKWDFSQKYSAIKMIQGSIFLFVVSCLGFFVTLTQNQHLTVGLVTLLVKFIAVVYFTEKAMKIEFPNP